MRNVPLCYQVPRQHYGNMGQLLFYMKGLQRTGKVGAFSLLSQERVTQVQNKKNPMHVFVYIKQHVIGEGKRKYLGRFYYHYERLAVVAIIGMLVLKMAHPAIDPWT